MLWRFEHCDTVSLCVCRKAASAQQPVGVVCVSERCQPQRERPKQDGPCPAHPDLRHRSNSPAHSAGPPPLLSACKSLTWCCLSRYYFNDVWFALDEFSFYHQHLSFCVLSPRVICWVVQRAWPTNQRPSRSLTACAGSSPHWVGSSSWVAIGRWSQRAATGCTLLRETQVWPTYRSWPILYLTLPSFFFFFSFLPVIFPYSF